MKVCAECHVAPVPSKHANARYCGRCRYLRQEASRSAGQSDRHCRALSETPESVERRFQQARAARLARERATGVRTFTVSDGWQQRSGRSSMDGELTMAAVAS